MQTMQDPAGDATGDELPPPSGPPRDPDQSPERLSDSPVLGGVALDLARRFGVDPLWPRLAFVGLALMNGFGVLAYLGLWLVMIVGRRPGRAAMRVVGAGVLVAAVFVLQDVDSPWIDSPWAWAVVLGGVAVALWAPRGIPAPASMPSGIAGHHDVALPPPAAAGSPPVPSVLGRATLGLAILVASGGALIDQINDGRLHPEQWLGASAAVCGIGLLVGAWRGRGVWLLVPGLLFAGAGFIAGHAARAGVDSLSMGGEDVWIDGGTTGPVSSTRLAGTTRLIVLDAPVTPQRATLRVGIGEIDIDVGAGVTVEVRPVVHDGEVRVDGRVEGSDTVTFGPAGEPDVIVDAEIGFGDVDVSGIDGDPRPVIVLPTPPRPPGLPRVVDGTIDLGDGLRLSPDGTLLLPDGIGAIGPEGEIWSPSVTPPRSNGVTVIASELGDYLLLPNQMIITPSGRVFDVAALRNELLGRSTSVSTTIAGG